MHRGSNKLSTPTVLKKTCYTLPMRLYKFSSDICSFYACNMATGLKDSIQINKTKPIFLLQWRHCPFIPAAAADAISPGRRSDGGKPPGRRSNWMPPSLPLCSSQTAAGQSSAAEDRAHRSIGWRLYFVTSRHQLNQPSGENVDRWACTYTQSDPVNEQHDEQSGLMRMGVLQRPHFCFLPCWDSL